MRDAREVLLDDPVALAKILLLLRRREACLEFELKADAGRIVGERDPVQAVALDDFDPEAADLCLQRARPEPARGAEIVLAAADGDAGESVHHVAVRVIAEPDVDQQFAAIDRMRGVPVALGEPGIAAAGLGKRLRRLVADKIVLGCQHCSCPYV
ncbi:hypothetical protein ACVIGA_006565 [Bradyrhizobium sp. USDA 3240]